MFASSAEARASLLADQLTLELRPELWAKLMRTHGVALRAHFTSESYSAEDPTIERVFLAARRAAPPNNRTLSGSSFTSGRMRFLPEELPDVPTHHKK